MIYRLLTTQDLTAHLFRHFNRHQTVTQCWREVAGRWVLKDIAFVEEWNATDHLTLADFLRNTVATGGRVLGAFSEDDKLIGFSSIEPEFFGSSKQYLALSNLHISYEHRGEGLGRELFLRTAQLAREMGAKKLYISTHSSKETHSFYRAMGCVDAQERNAELVELEPCDRQMEYTL